MNSKTLLPEASLHVPVEGGNLAVYRYGPDGGKPILALHGITSTNRAWQWFAGSIVPHGYTIYAPDLRGRGDSSPLPGPYGMSAHARDMLAIVNYLMLEKIDVIGHSMGGWVAIAFLNLAPERISRTVLMDGGILLPLPPGFTVEALLPYVLGPALARLDMTFESREAYRNFWKSQPAFVRGWNSALDEYVDYDLRGSEPHLHASTVKAAVLADAEDEFVNPLIEDTLRNLPARVLMLRSVRGLQNEESPLYPEELLSRTLIQYPKIDLVTVPDCNHYEMVLNQETTDACARLIYGIGEGVPK